MLDLEILNKEQRKAVETTDGPVLVLAGAGSGKTRVLTYRMAYILDAGLAGADNVLAMTFTNKAAGEMKERIVKLLKENSSKTSKTIFIPWMGTFHSICLRILKIYGEFVGLDKSFTIYDSSDQTAVIKEAMKTLNISTKEFNPNAIHSYISSAKNQLINEVEYAQFSQGYFQQIVAEVYPEYQKILRESNAVDFDDLIMLTIKLLQENQVILHKLQDTFRYILVDEYQDTNHAQYSLIKLLAAKHRNICCVGDDDQSIYAFRGATIKNILSFEKDYQDSVVIKLEQNYRSTKKILEASHQVISKNTSRKDKKLWTENHDGENITIYTANDEGDEGRWIVEQILEKKHDDNYSEFAVLYRTNAQSRSLEEAFINYGLPYKIIGGVRFYERKEIKDILAYLKLIHNNKDNSSLERIINVPRRGIGPKTFVDIKREVKSQNLSVLEYLVLNSDRTLVEELEIRYSELRKTAIVNTGSVNPKLKAFADMMVDLLNKSTELNIVDLVNYLLDRTGYIEMLEDGTTENESRIENIKELISVAARYENKDPIDALDAFLQDVSLLEGNAEEQKEGEYVTLMTIHSAKGLEFEYVFVAGVEENLFPHSNSLYDEKELEEERRLAYVAITRAKHYLYLTHTRNRLYFGKLNSNPLSRFVADIDKNLITYINNDASVSWAGDDYSQSENLNYFVNTKLGQGDKVKHEYFGIGKVVSIDDEMVEIDFGEIYGVKELMLEYAKLDKLN
jgi:DNA helicase-2/ATP-dependent DNA helicase PcrA